MQSTINLVKILIILFLLTGISNLYSQKLIYENYHNFTDFTVLIPTDFCNVKSDTPVELNLIFSVYHSRKLMLEKQIRLHWNYTEDLNLSEYFVHRFTESLFPGVYDVNIKVQNFNSKSFIVSETQIFIYEQDIRFSNMHILKYYNDNILYPYGEDWFQQADSLFIAMSFYKQPVKIEVYHNENIIASFDTPENFFEKLDIFFFHNDINMFTARVIYEDKNIFMEFQPFNYVDLITQNYSYRQRLQQLRYIMSQNEYEFLRRLSDEDLPFHLELFWRKNDPSPQQYYNELKQLFYNRVNFADRHFFVTGYRTGWQTDRGMIFIKYGDPDEILNENYPIGKYPVIIWIYYSPNKRFYFDDKKGFGHYELREEWLSN